MFVFLCIFLMTVLNKVNLNLNLNDELAYAPCLTAKTNINREMNSWHLGHL